MAINENKYRNAILYFASHINNLGKVKLMKLFYYLDFDHYEQFGTSVTGDEYRHYPMGPVPINAEAVVERMVTDEQLLVTEENVGLRNLQCRYQPLRHYDVSVFSPTEVEMLCAVAEKWQHHSGGEMVRAVHGEPPWLETDDWAVIDYRLAFKRSVREMPEEEQMNENLSAEEREAREKGLQLVAQLEQRVQSDPEFRRQLQIGFDQVEDGQTVFFGGDGWE